ncbi:GNAT family N-acetyltransferase [Streptomyces iconiensis]|uniref:GNAT family N-acetyltransferase n=1 Tax=Streptomyces iconiensis TaxID=1384038 RepID=A0ABT7A9R0_9ACTN|nr:GNAT family N-acetyltransferase [Streptomyces iconiensis]MDJ1137787.1 GNAT family N-acetyltransferase [Streptomyces iconiensis]
MSEQRITVTTWYLEQASAGELVAAREPGDEVRVARAEVPSPEFSRFLYSAVGQDVTWTDRLVWTHARWREFLERPGVETWVAYERGTPAGFIELDGGRPEAVDTVEISYFGLLPAFRGRGIGGHLLAYGTARAWDMAGRWEGRAPTKRVWVHTCTKDGQYARANYERRGFRLYRTESEEQPVVPTPGPWPGA